MFDKCIKMVVAGYENWPNREKAEYYAWLLIYGIKNVDKIDSIDSLHSVLVNIKNVLIRQSGVLNGFSNKYIKFFATEYANKNDVVRTMYHPELGDEYRRYIIDICDICLRDSSILSEMFDCVIK